MQLAFHNEFLSSVEMQQPLAEPAVDMLAWKVAAVIVLLKFIAWIFFLSKMPRDKPLP